MKNAMAREFVYEVADRESVAVGVSFENNFTFSRPIEREMTQEEVIEFMKNEFDSSGSQELDQILLIGNGKVTILTEF